MSGGSFVAADIGGTNARFVRVDVENGRLDFHEPIVFPTQAHSGVEDVWPLVLAHVGISPCGLSLSVAGPAKAGKAKLTNGDWSFDKRDLAHTLGLDRIVLVNDLEAVAHCAARTPATSFQQLKPGRLQPERASTLGVVGVGTGFGFARIERFGTQIKIVGTEAGHAGFAPSNSLEADLVRRCLASNARMSNERLLSGDGLLIFAHQFHSSDPSDHAVSLWTFGLDGSDAQASEAVGQFCAALGSVIGDIVLSQGLDGVVLAGGVLSRLKDHLRKTEFFRAFSAKAPMEKRMEDVGIFALHDREPGLTGAALAFAHESNMD